MLQSLFNLHVLIFAFDCLAGEQGGDDAQQPRVQRPADGGQGLPHRGGQAAHAADRTHASQVCVTFSHSNCFILEFFR